MPLPEKVIEQLGREPSGTQGWAVGALLFSGGILFLALVIYAGLAFGYEPYVQSQLTAEQNKVSALNQSIPGSDQSQLIGYYSQIANLQILLQKHTNTTQLFSWLEKNTEANVHFQSLALAAANQMTVVGVGATEADINQQVAIFENAPEVSSVTVSNVTAPQIPGNGWTFDMVLVMNPSAMQGSSQ